MDFESEMKFITLNLKELYLLMKPENCFPVFKLGIFKLETINWFKSYLLAKVNM